MLTPQRGSDGLPTHLYYRQPLKVAVCFCLPSLFTCKRVSEFLQRNLVACIILFQLVSDIFPYHFFVLSNCVHIVPSAPEISTPIFVFLICVSVKYHQCAFALERPHKLCYTYIWWNTHQHMDMIRARLCFYDFYLHLFTQFPLYYPYISLYLSVYHFPSVLRCKHHMILTSITRMSRMFQLILLFV